MKNLILPILGIVMFLASCEKKAPVPAPGREDMLRKGKWKIASGTVRLKMPNNLPGTTDYVKVRELCLLDDYLKFDSLNYGFVGNGDTACSVADPDSVQFTWRLLDNGNTLQILNGFKIRDSMTEQIVYNTDMSRYDVVFGPATTRKKDILDGKLTDVSESSFTLNYYLPAQSLDTTGGRQTSPLVRPDTFYYSVKYVNY